MLRWRRPSCNRIGSPACWSLVHGLTLLLADGLVGPRKKSGALGDSLVQGMLDRLAAELPALPPGTWVGPQVPQR